MNKPRVIYMVCVLMITSLIPIGIAQENNKWGGIQASISNPPNGTTIDESLSSYYGRVVAVGAEETYWYIGGWGWFNRTEMVNLPSNSLMHDISPYDCESSGNCGSESVQTAIPVPVSPMVGLAFIGIGYLIWKRYHVTK